METPVRKRSVHDRVSSASPRSQDDLLQSLDRSAEERRQNVQLMFQKDQQDKAEKKRLDQRQKEIVGGMMGMLIKTNGAIAALDTLKHHPFNLLDRQRFNHHMEILKFYRDSITEFMPSIKQLPSDSKLLRERGDSYMEETAKKQEYIDSVHQFISRVKGTGFMKRKSRNRRGKLRKRENTRKM